jgi:hypothetical protein
MADSTTNLTLIAVNQAAKEVTANGLFDAGSHATSYGRRQEFCIGLTWAFYGGRVAGLSVPNGSVALTASATNYVTVNRTTGAVTAAITAYSWCDPINHARLYKVQCDAVSPTSFDDYRYSGQGVFAGPLAGSDQVEIVMPLGDASTAVTTGAGRGVRRAPCAMYLTDVRASVATASSSGVPAFDINVGGLSALGTALTIDVSERTSTTAAAPFTFAEQGDVIVDDQEIVMDVDTAGTSTAGLAITLIGVRSRSTRYRDLQSLLIQGQGANAGTVFTDSSPRAKTLTAIGNITTSTAVADPWGGGLSSLLLDGAGDGLSLPYSADVDLGAGDFTVRGFARLATSTDLRPLVDFRGTSGTFSSWMILADAATRSLGIYNGPTNAVILAGATNSLPASGTWFSWQVSRRGGTVYVLSDGVLRNSGAYAPPATQATGVRIGLDTSGTQSWHGYLRDTEIIKGVGLQIAAYTPARRAAPAY